MSEILAKNISEEAARIYLEDNKLAGTMTWKEAIEKAKELLM